MVNVSEAATVPPISSVGTKPIPPVFVTDPVPDHTKTDKSDDSKKRGSGIKLGVNKKPRSGVRALNGEDLEKLSTLYGMLSIPAYMLKPELGEALAENADSCAEGWAKLAAENDSVRRAILAMLEGSAWAGVISVHAPILIACIPQRALDHNPAVSMLSRMMKSEKSDDE